KKRIEKWMPIDMYIGGAEHSVLHLLYTRFIIKVLNDLGFISFKEPFKKFRAHGLIIKEGKKMSKSKGNVINPDDYIERVGADVLRTYLMFLAPFEQGGDFRDAGIMGIDRFIQRVWKLFQKPLNANSTDEGLEKVMHQTIKKVAEDIENLKYNTAISQLMIFLNKIEDKKESVTREVLETLLKLLAPFAPYLTEELWRNTLGEKQSIHTQQWPEYKEELLKEDNFDLIIQINGKTRDTIKTEKGVSEEKAIEISKSSDKINKYLKVGEIKKIIFVQDNLINFVIK
ncbi:MAG: class I tRNA ligase family protein, partial [Candidatus Paceibacterota bacterium]